MTEQERRKELQAECFIEMLKFFSRILNKYTSGMAEIKREKTI